VSDNIPDHQRLSKAVRNNGLARTAPDPDQTILVAGGAGYIGCVLVPKLLDRGYRVRMRDRLFFGDDGLAGVCNRIELLVANVRELPPDALDGIDGVINLSGLSNDPTAEFKPEANWQTSAIATETPARACLERGRGSDALNPRCHPPRLSEITGELPFRYEG
jgi:hypothetical protein